LKDKTLELNHLERVGNNFFIKFKHHDLAVYKVSYFKILGRCTLTPRDFQGDIVKK